MALKYKITADEFEALDEGVQALYTKDGDGHILNVTGAVDSGKLKEFRTSNQTLQGLIDSMKEKYGDIDMDEVNKLLQTKHDLDDKKLIKEGDIEGLLEKRLRKVVDPLNAKILTLEGINNSSQETLAKLTIDNRVTKQGAKMGAHETALDDLCHRARKVFTVDKEGNAVALDSDGDALTDDKGQKLDIESWLGTQKTKDAPHCFKQSKGGNEKGDEGKHHKAPEGELTSHERIQKGLKERGYGG